MDLTGTTSQGIDADGGEIMDNGIEMLLVFGAVWVVLFVFFYSRIAGNKLKAKRHKSI